ncbi:hypothetical protein [Fuscibacter oryzae]|uniref:Uncharacterized protein n=1 Tax=Fuscibacter oryzae TaxID=2803939 RepID=A0A8J7SVG5_9RHOB|nr:hypothetical protein [Fuscibacter oryzae]MBL4927804.1 hypothetical protein [Fuscibacter oryzae]
MSEAMSKVEIEDVLSSIRRLVSEDSKPSIVRGGPSLERRDMTLGPERLILTPALRVVAEELAEPAIPPAAAPIGALVAGLGAAVDAQQEEWEPETGDEQPPLPEGAAVLEDAEWEGEWEDEGPVLTFAAYPRVQLVNPILPPRAVPVEVAEVAEAVDPWATLPRDEILAEAAPDIIAEAASEIAPEIIEATVEDTHPDVATWAQEGEDEPFDTLARGAPTIEPDLAWADAAEAEAVEELSSEIAGRIDPAEAQAIGEEALRELVRELIVEELQGALGQRITRNIRKLIRAEISRAVATQDLY